MIIDQQTLFNIPVELVTPRFVNMIINYMFGVTQHVISF